MIIRIQGTGAKILVRTVQFFQWTTLLTGTVLVCWPVLVQAESALAQWSGERQLASTSKQRPERVVEREPEGAKNGVRLATGSVLGKLEIPRLKLSWILLEGTDARTLDKSIGHVEGTSLIGEPGNVSIAGHRNTHFRKLEWIRRGDEIVLTSPRGSFRYRVEWGHLFTPDAIEVLDPSHGPAVTLITCFPFEYVGSAPLRFIVRALPEQETRDRFQGGTKTGEQQQ